jgi:hypothetical protein
VMAPLRMTVGVREAAHAHEGARTDAFSISKRAAKLAALGCAVRSRWRRTARRSSLPTKRSEPRGCRPRAAEQAAVPTSARKSGRSTASGGVGEGGPIGRRTGPRRPRRSVKRLLGDVQRSRRLP